MRGISKTLYCSGVQCPKMLWLKKHMPELEEQTAAQSVFDNGNRIGDLAMGLLGEFTEVEYTENKMLMIEKTKELLEAGTEVICEATFATEGLFCSLDIMHNKPDGTVDFYEVKSSTGLKDVYYKDAAFQLYVLEKLGFNVDSVYLVNVNSSYVLEGDLDIHKFFNITDVTAAVKAMQEDTAGNIEYLQNYIAQETEPERELHIGCFQPYACGFWGHCACGLPEHNVFELSRINKDKALSLYYSGKSSFENLIEEKLSDAQRIQVEAELSGEKLIDRKKVSDFMSKNIRYPLYFLDFESFQPAIPIFQGTRPYQQIAFQYSLHIINEEGEAPEDAIHREFIAEPGTDPRRAVAERLCEDIPADACVLAYNKSFEQGRIKEMAECCPELSGHLMSIHGNIVDLITPFQKKFVYYPAMNGSASIKEVLPALFPDDPDLDYHNLEGVHKGDEASAIYEKMSGMPEDEKEYYMQCLYKYCGLDTFAMVKIWQKLKELSK